MLVHILDADGQTVFEQDLPAGLSPTRSDSS
jgi:hypothetical protein